MLSPKLLDYYMCVIVPIVHQCLIDIGVPQSELSKEITHMYLRERFCPSMQEWSEKDGKFIAPPKSVKALSNAAFFLFKEDIQRWAVTFLGVYIPDPNEEIKSWVLMPD